MTEKLALVKKANPSAYNRVCIKLEVSFLEYKRFKSFTWDCFVKGSYPQFHPSHSTLYTGSNIALSIVLLSLSLDSIILLTD